MRNNSLSTEIVNTARKLLRAIQFEELHRDFLDGQDDNYWVADPDRLCFFDSARLDVIGHFGETGWLPEMGGYCKIVDGVTIKLLTDIESKTAPITLPKPVPKLDAVASHGCKVSIPVYGNN